MNELHTERVIAMPNEIFKDMQKWTAEKKIKSAHHQEFIYSYYWLVAYLWRYAKYAERAFTQSIIKQMLGYNPSEKRLDYLIKSCGLLDIKGYTKAVRDYPVTWDLKNGEDLTFSMLSEYSPEDRAALTTFKSSRFIVKAPLKSIGTEFDDGIFWYSSNTHWIDGEIFKTCMEDSELGCPGFYMYGLLTYIQDKSNCFNGSSTFPCSNKTLSELTGWSTDKVLRITTALAVAGWIQKEQKVRVKGAVNYYTVLN